MSTQETKMCNHHTNQGEQTRSAKFDSKHLSLQSLWSLKQGLTAATAAGKQPHHVNKWAEPRSSKTLFTESAAGGSAFRHQLTSPWNISDLGVPY